ncbi:MAG TPA: sialidase family protein [Bryobacteraceae bacterium]|nr:sialidase family protein [Bryobacteraceae bacterium]
MRYLLPFLVVISLHAAELKPGGTDELRQPQLAVGHGKVALAYGSGSAIWFRSSADEGRTFTAPVKVADMGALALGRHRGPRVTILSDALLITAVVAREPSHAEHAHGLPEKGELTVWRSTDNGKTWTRTGTINDVPAAAEEGLHAIAADAKGNLFAAWLDHRGKGTELYGARSIDGGRTWSKNVRIYASPDGTICQCCDPSIALDEQGVIHVMWRNVLDGSRDFYLAESKDGEHFGAARKLGEGTWKLNACPMDGGGMAFDQGKLITAWRRESEIFLDRPGDKEVGLGEGKDVAIAASSKGVYVIWSSLKGIRLLAPGTKTAVKLADDGGFPAVAGLPDGSALAAWEENSSIRIERLP